MRNAPLGLLMFLLFCTAAARPAPLVDVKARAMRAGYTADLQALSDAARDARALAADPTLAPLAHYWAGYAFWQRAVNEVNLKADPAQIAADRDAALKELEAALAAREAFADAHALVAWLHGWLYSADAANKDAHAKELLAHHTRARELEPDNPRVLWAYAIALQFRDKPKALGLMDELTRRPDAHTASAEPDWGVPEACMTLAWIDLNAGDVAAAETLARRARELRPGWHYVEAILIPQIEAKKGH
jgi:hypothetical protein